MILVWMSVRRWMQIDPYLPSHTKLKSKQIKDLDIKPDILNFKSDFKTINCNISSESAAPDKEKATMSKLWLHSGVVCSQC